MVGVNAYGGCTDQRFRTLIHREFSDGCFQGGAAFDSAGQNGCFVSGGPALGDVSTGQMNHVRNPYERLGIHRSFERVPVVALRGLGFLGREVPYFVALLFQKSRKCLADQTCPAGD